MPVTSAWYDDERTIVHMLFTEPWSINEMSEAIHTSCLLMQDVAHSVDLIMNASMVQRIPPNIITHFIVSKDGNYIPQNQRYVVVTVQNRYINSIIGVARRVLAPVTKKMLVASTLDEALDLLYARRQTPESQLEKS